MDHKYKITTLCYIKQGDKYLMLYRNKKKADENGGKWVGIGGKLENGESPEECMLREVYEETGLFLTGYTFHGVITFISDVYDNEYMMLYSSEDFEGTLRKDCPEGELHWVEKSEIMRLPMWEGDPRFLRELIKGTNSINMKLVYEGEKLVQVISGEQILRERVNKFASDDAGEIGTGRLIQNLIDQLKEAQIKLGFAMETTRFYYPLSSLNELLGSSFSEGRDAVNALMEDKDLHRTGLGKLGITAHGERIEISLSPEAAKYVHSLPEPAFLSTLIEAFGRNHHMHEQEVLDLFAPFGGTSYRRVDPEAGFDFAVWFQDSSEDSYVYCFKEEMGHMIYHRFTRADYEKLIDND